jgi:hypothetical protein
MVHSSKPGKMLQKLFTEGRLQPGEVFVLGGPTSDKVLVVSLMAQDIPGLLPIASLDTMAYEVTSLSSQGQVLASFGGRGQAKRTVSLVHHGWSVRLLSVSRQRPISSSKSVTQL